MKKIIAAMIIVCLAFTFAGCGKNKETSSPSPTPTATPEPVKKDPTYPIEDYAGKYSGNATAGGVTYEFTVELKTDGTFDFTCDVTTPEGKQDLNFNGVFVIEGDDITANVPGYLPIPGEFGKDFELNVQGNMVFGDNSPSEYITLEKQ